MILPTEALAKKVASEWDEQVEEIHPTTMPFTKSANVALDKVSEQFEEVSSLLGEYGETDLLYYRADSPLELQKRQKTGWDPIVKWAENTFKVQINCGTGIVYIPQNEKLFLETPKKINNLSIKYQFSEEWLKESRVLESVSYTHLTLPTSDLV